MRIEFGGIEIKTPYEEYLEKFVNCKNPFEVMFSKANLDLSNDLYKNVSANKDNFLEEFTKVMKSVPRWVSSIYKMINTYNRIIRLATYHYKDSANHNTKKDLIRKVRVELTDDGCE